MSRLQYCRKHIDDVAEACDLSKSTVLEVKQASTFCDDNSEFSELPTSAILTLIRVSDDLVKERAISSISKALESKRNPVTGKIIKDVKGLTAKDIKKIIDIACTEIRMERPPEDPPVKSEEKKESPKKEVPPAVQPAPPKTSPATPTIEDVEKHKRERMEALATELLGMYSPTIQAVVSEIMRDHPSYKVKDVFYFGIQALAEQKKK
jgi:hypothetical protein